jgi:peptide/nickel transport system substrate-binding protein
MRSIVRIVQSLACVAIVGSIATAAIAETPKRGGVLRHVIEGEPTSFDCHSAATSFALQVLAPHYSTLLKYDNNDYSKIIGDLADSWTASPDKLTYTFKLKPGVKFHDGSELVSADIKATFDRLRNPPAGVSRPTSRRRSIGCAIRRQASPPRGEGNSRASIPSRRRRPIRWCSS